MTTIMHMSSSKSYKNGKKYNTIYHDARNLCVKSNGK